MHLPYAERSVARYAMPAVLFVAALALYLQHLSVPPEYMYDEHYHAYTAAQYVAGNRDAYLWNTRAPRSDVAYTWNHPPLGLVLIAGGISLWGDRPFGWRFASAVFGAIGIVVAYLLALRLSRDREVAELTGTLLLLDGLYFVQSRTSMLDVFLVVFLMCALLCFHAYLTAPLERVRRALLGTGLFLGMALATKWSASYPAALIGLVVVYRTILPARYAGHDARTARRTHLLWLPVALGLVPAAVYLAAYIPFFLTGHTFGQFLELQRQTYLYHTGLRATHAYQSSWWQWPLAARPVWYYVRYAPGSISNIYAQGNPILYWAFVPAAVWLGVRWWRQRSAALLPFLIGFFGQWLPWALVPRIAFAYHFLPAVPFGVIAVAAAFMRGWRAGGRLRVVAIAWLVAVALAFAFFYPIYAAVPLSPRALALRFWFPSWR